MKLIKFDEWNFKFYCNQEMTDAKTDELSPKFDEFHAKVRRYIENNLPNELILFPEEKDKDK